MEKNRNFLKIFHYAFRGVYLAVKIDRNAKIQIAVALAVLLLAFVLRVSVIEFLFVIVASFLVIILELINTALEKTMDFIHQDYHPEIGMIKDILAGAVWLTAVMSLVIGLTIFLPKIIKLLQ